MWNLSGEDIQRAKEELKGRRAAIKAHYDEEMRKLEADIAAIENFERAAVDFVSNFKGEDNPPGHIADPGRVMEDVGAVGTSGQNRSAEEGTSVEENPMAAAEPGSEPMPVAQEKNSSRWRMRLGAAEGSR